MQFFSFNLELICFLWVFQKAEISLVQINSKLNSKPYDDLH